MNWCFSPNNRNIVLDLYYQWLNQESNIAWDMLKEIQKQEIQV